MLIIILYRDKEFINKDEQEWVDKLWTHSKECGIFIYVLEALTFM